MNAVYDLTWAIPLPPAAAFVLIVLFANRNKQLSAAIAIGGAALSLALGWAVALTAFRDHHLGEHPVDGTLFRIPTGTGAIDIGYALDPANALMLFMVTFLLVMIFVYSRGYMTFPHHLSAAAYPEAHAEGKDPRYSRFFAYISLFAAGMLGLVIADNLITFFVFWEIMGLCSYLLIGFWFEKESAKRAALKAFVTTRIGDALLFAGMLLLYVNSEPSSLSFSALFSEDNLVGLSRSYANLGFREVTWLSVITFLILGGTVGKSAQFPLHVWLPDAMEGPTPVSAMIHAATMVSAGVFLLVRMYPLYDQALELTSATMVVVAAVGAFTALFAATIALAQWDIKRVLAYSTISQLGYMVAALGIGAYAAALFHLLTHAFFKALLFLGSGSVIHGMEHGHEHAHGHADDPADHAARPSGLAHRLDGTLDPDDPQDMRNMGGLLRRMPATGYTFIIGGLALSGFPLVTAGFWSKDEILAFAFEGHGWVFLVLALAAFCTAFYTMRQMALTFGGRARTAMAAHAPESVRSMTVPLILISFFAVTLGWIGIPDAFPVLGNLAPNWLGHYLEPFMETLHIHVHHPTFQVIPLATSVVVALGGLALGWRIYGRGLAEDQVDPLAAAFGPLWQLWHRKYFIDELYAATVVRWSRNVAAFCADVDQRWIIDPFVNWVGRLSVWIAALAAAVDTLLVDGLVNLVGRVTRWSGGILTRLQDGKVQAYLLVALTVLAIWIVLVGMPVVLTLV